MKQPKSPKSEYMTRFKQWQAQNPVLLYRQAQGLTRAEFATIVGAGLSTVERWEKGTAVPSEKSWAHLKAIDPDVANK